jgi:hypothetical protein
MQIKLLQALKVDPAKAWVRVYLRAHSKARPDVPRAHGLTNVATTKPRP